MFVKLQSIIYLRSNLVFNLELENSRGFLYYVNPVCERWRKGAWCGIAPWGLDLIWENKWLETTKVFKSWKQLEVGAEIPGFVFSY